jgi:UTP--glucose-1-phosphate uridylyltransferase
MALRESSLGAPAKGLELSEATPDRLEKERSMGRVLQTIVDTTSNDEERTQVRAEMRGFTKLFHRFVDSKMEEVDWPKIRLPSDELVVPHNELPKLDVQKDVEEIRSLLSKLVVLKLNGGLGTTMGCIGPKSAIEVCDDMNFLDLVVRQLRELNERFGADVPLVLMNSFNTDAETKRILGKYSHQNVKVYTFNQSRYPRIWKDSLLPIGESNDAPGECWYPPGHGDIYQAFVRSGLADRLLALGKQVVFAANIDNLGALVDFDILRAMVCGIERSPRSSSSNSGSSSGGSGDDDANGVPSSLVASSSSSSLTRSEAPPEFIMELTPKTRADVKGGTLVEYEGAARLLELAQVPDDRVPEFKSIKKFKVFNTNNLWINVAALKRVATSGALNTVDIIVNRKSVGGKGVIQLETAAGAAIKFFENAIGVRVGRHRFLPVKSTSDLFIVQSNLYRLDTGGRLVLNPLRPFPSLPLIKFGTHFKLIDDFYKRFNGRPDLLELDHLTVSGDVYFGKRVVLKGTVIIVAQHGSRIDIPDGAVLEDKIISGNLRILDH